MAAGQDEELFAASRQFVSRYASQEDLTRLQIASAELRLILTKADRSVAIGSDGDQSTILTIENQHLPQIDSPGSFGFMYKPSGSVKQFFIKISQEEQFKSLLSQLQIHLMPLPLEVALDYGG